MIIPRTWPLTFMGRRAFASPPVFDPATLFTGGEIGDYWKFDNVNTDQPTPGGEITSATGLVNGRVLGFADASNTPDLDLSSGHYSADFDGTNDRLFHNFGSTLTQPATIIACVNQSSALGSKVFVTGSSTTLRQQMSMDSSSNIIMFAGSTLDSTLDAPQGVKVFTCVFNGASSVFRSNGTQTATGNAGTQGTNRLTIGALYDGTVGSTTNFYSLIYINRLLTAPELDSAERLLGSHAGISW